MARKKNKSWKSKLDKVYPIIFVAGAAVLICALASLALTYWQAILGAVCGFAGGCFWMKNRSEKDDEKPAAEQKEAA